MRTNSQFFLENYKRNSMLALCGPADNINKNDPKNHKKKQQ